MVSVCSPGVPRRRKPYATPYSRAELVRLAEAYLDYSEIGISTLGRHVVNNDKFFQGLQLGRDCRVSNAERATEWFSLHWPKELEWPSGVPDRRLRGRKLKRVEPAVMPDVTEE